MTSSDDTRKSWRNWTITIKVWKILATLVVLPILVFWMMVVHQNDEIIALVRNDRTSAMMGPFRDPWEFGYLMAEPPK